VKPHRLPTIPKQTPPPEQGPGRMTDTDTEKSPFTEHLGELRSRLIYSFIAVIIGFAAAYGFSEQIFQILTAPLTRAMEGNANTQMIFTGLPEAFFPI